MTPLRLAVALLLLALFGVSQAVEIEVLEADDLQFRPIQIPGGEETELVVITGSPVRLTVDGDPIVAEYIEFDRESRILRIVGPGNVAYENVATKGRDYLLNLGSGELNFKDVFIFTEPLDIEGVQATRLPGQIDISGGVFSPCSRCEQQVQDYRFRAERMILYPGDRLVAFNVTVYLRELPSFFLPLLVVPLGPEERRPRFSLERGSQSNDFRASAALDWPYVFGANAFGTASLRYFADVNPGGSSGPAETILGGQVERNYLGGGFDHRFYTERGRGNLRFFYTPPFVEEFEVGGRTRDEYEYTFAYETEEALEGLQTDVLLGRSDSDNPRIFNLTARLSNSYGGFDFGYVTQTYFDLDPDDDTFSPSYEVSEGALRTYARVQVSPEEDLTFSVGPFTLTNLLLEAGLYEDYANASNFSALASPLGLGGTPIVRGGRLLERHTITLETLSPFPGSSLSGSTDFTGQYYTTVNADGENERLVDWTTTLSAEQTFPGGAFGVDFNRVILEGETPFQFDARITPDSRTDLNADLSLTPAEWLEVSIEETYVFQDSRNLDDLGAGPLETRVELFNNLEWLDASLEHAYDFQENDPGLLGSSVGLTSPGDLLSASARLSGVYDLAQTPPDRAVTTPVNESEVDIETSFDYSVYTALDLAVGYDFNADPDTFGDPYEDFDEDGDIFNPEDPDFAGEPRYKPLVVGLTLGTTEQGDALPSIRVAAARDINKGVMESIEFEANTRLGPLELSAEQTFDFVTRSADDSLLTLSYPDIVQLEAAGFSLLPPSLVGLTPNPENTVSYEVNLVDLTQQDLDGTGLYELSYQTSYGLLDTFDGSVGGAGFYDTSLTAQVDLETAFVGTPLGPLGFGVTFSGVLAIADAALPLTYFSDGSLLLTTDFFSRVAVQGSLSYVAEYDAYDAYAGPFSEQYLTLEDFGLTVRVWDDLYVSALLYDVWDFAGTLSEDANEPFNLQPVFFVTLDRCCWAFYGAFDSRDGTISLTLGYPGSSEGLTGAFTSPFILPRREGE
jgi:hypothetical protein